MRSVGPRHRNVIVGCGYCSVKHHGDLVFHDDFTSMSHEGALRYVIAITAENETPFVHSMKGRLQFSKGRITQQFLRMLLHKNNIRELQCFLCGGNSMVKDVKESLLSIGVPPGMVLHESW